MQRLPICCSGHSGQICFSVTLPVATRLFANVAVPPDNDTASPETAPLKDRSVTAADVPASYSLSSAVKLPVMLLTVMSAVVVATDPGARNHLNARNYFLHLS